MDNLTHSLVGALLGQAGLKQKTGLAMPALIIGANLPDVDAACFLWLEGVEHVGFRRGITHGPIAWVLLPLILAGLLWGFDRWQAGRGKRPEGRLPVNFKWLYLLSFIGCLTHPALDWLNVYGIRLLEPFSSQWFYGDTLFIIDVWLWALMGFAIWFSLRREKRGGEWKQPARVAIVLALTYIGVNKVITEWYESTRFEGEVPRITDIASPVPFSFWERDVIRQIDHRYIRFGEAADVICTSDNQNCWAELDGDGVIYRSSWTAGKTCVWPDVAELRHINSQLDAFLFWSRAPFAERAPDGSVILRDARFYDPRARDRFSVALPNVKCEEPDAE